MERGRVRCETMCVSVSGDRILSGRTDHHAAQTLTVWGYVNHMQQVSKAAVVHDARATRVQIGCSAPFSARGRPPPAARRRKAAACTRMFERRER